MTSNNNQILPPTNIWSHFISGRLNPTNNMMPMVPPNWMFPYLSVNKQQFETIPNPYSMETIQMFRTMLNRRNQLQQSTLNQNILPKNPCLPPLFGLQKSVDFFLARSPGSSNITSPIDQGFGSAGESGSNFDNIDGQKSDINSTRCPVCNQSIVEFEMESHLTQELGTLSQNSRNYKDDNPTKPSSNTSPANNESELKFDISNISSPQSQISYQTSLNRYKNFEKIKFNRHQRKNTLLIHQKTIIENSPGEKTQYSLRSIGNKQQKNNNYDCGISSKKPKISDETEEIIDVK